MDDFRSAYATSGEVTALWQMVAGLREQVRTLTARLETLESGPEAPGAEARAAGGNALSAASDPVP